MIRDKPILPPKVHMRERVLDAAERVLASGSAEFSMRQLAEEAGVSFATPFNQFGNKATIMLALSARRIALMNAQLSKAELGPMAVSRVLTAVDVAAAVMLTSPSVNRAVMGAISAPTDTPGDVSSQSSALWSKALGTGKGLASATRPMALAFLPNQLAIAFRGVLSFWTAGELSDEALGHCARAAAATALLGFVGRDGRAALMDLIKAGPQGFNRSR